MYYYKTSSEQLWTKKSYWVSMKLLALICLLTLPLIMLCWHCVTLIESCTKSTSTGQFHKMKSGPKPSRVVIWQQIRALPTAIGFTTRGPAARESAEDPPLEDPSRFNPPPIHRVHTQPITCSDAAGQRWHAAFVFLLVRQSEHTDLARKHKAEVSGRSQSAETGSSSQRPKTDTQTDNQTDNSTAKYYSRVTACARQALVSQICRIEQHFPWSGKHPLRQEPGVMLPLHPWENVTSLPQPEYAHHLYKLEMVVNAGARSHCSSQAAAGVPDSTPLRQRRRECCRRPAVGSWLQEDALLAAKGKNNRMPGPRPRTIRSIMIHPRVKKWTPKRLHVTHVRVHEDQQFKSFWQPATN